MNRSFVVLLAAVAATASVVGLSGCGDKKEETTNTPPPAPTASIAPAASGQPQMATPQTNMGKPPK